MSFFTPPPLRPKPERPKPPGFTNFHRRGVYIVMFTSMIFLGLVFAAVTFVIVRFLLWSWFVQMGHSNIWVTFITILGFVIGAKIGNWSGKLVLIEIVKQAEQQKMI